MKRRLKKEEPKKEEATQKRKHKIVVKLNLLFFSIEWHTEF